MNAVLTGAVHIGKSTVCSKVAHWAQQHAYGVCGIITTPVWDPAGGRSGLQVHSLESHEGRILAHVDGDWEGPSVGPYHFDPAALQWGSQIITRGLSSGCELLVLDEVGRLELEQAAGFHSILPLLESAGVPRMLIVVRSTLLDLFRASVPKLQFSTFEVTLDNRDLVADEVISFLFGSTQQG